MQFNPHPYQKTAIDFIIDNPKCALFLDMGLGKTSISLTAVESLLNEHYAASRVLVIGPLRIARDTWPQEAAKWDHLARLTLAVAVGDEKTRLKALSASADVTVINRENVPWLVKHYGKRWPFDMVVIDESSSFKNHKSQRFRALKAVLPFIDRLVELTGTPASNGLMDLWSQYYLLDQGTRLGKYLSHYQNSCFTPDKRNGYQVYSWKPKPGAEADIYERISDITLSMRTCDHLTLPEVIFTNRLVHLSKSEENAYKLFKHDMVLNLGEEEVDATNAAALAGKLTQYASGCVYDTEKKGVEVHAHKLDALEDIIEAANGSPVMVAYWFKSDLARLQARFPQARTLDTSESMNAWNAGDIPLALIHPAAAGHGLNLQHGGHHLVWFTLPWSLELYQQTNARLHRQGQKHTVTIQHIITVGTIDSRILEALGGKATTQDHLIEAVKSEL